MLPLQNRIAVITGASSGIGEATARKLASLGAKVALVARRVDRLEQIAADISAEGGNATVIAADVSHSDQANRAVDLAVKRFGSIDIVVNAAGLMLIGKNESADIAEWQQMLRVNIDGTLFMTHASLPHLLAAASGERHGVADLVNISSSAALQVFPVNGVYVMT